MTLFRRLIVAIMAASIMSAVVSTPAHAAENPYYRVQGEWHYGSLYVATHTSWAGMWQRQRQWDALSTERGLAALPCSLIPGGPINKVSCGGVVAGTWLKYEHLLETGLREKKCIVTAWKWGGVFGGNPFSDGGYQRLERCYR